MATLSYTIGQDLQAIRSIYQEDNNFEACQVLNLAEDFVDGFSKNHDPAPIYLNRLHDAFVANMERPDTTVNEVEAYREVLEIIAEYQKKLPS